MKNNNCLIIGPSIKSGIGGVTIHLQRLCEQLDSFGFKYQFCDYKSVPLKDQIRIIKRSQLVHLHICNPIRLLLMMVVCLLFKKKVIFTYHGDILSQKKMAYSIGMFALKRSNVPILINKGSFEHVIRKNKNAVLMSAFIPPVENKEVLPSNVLSIISGFKSNIRYLYSTNASARVFGLKGAETYGIDFLVDYFTKNSQDGLVLMDPSNQYTDYYKDRSFDNILIISGKYSYYALARESDFIIRNTCKDGDSLTVKEGLYQGKIVLCSDCVQRPQGVVLFHYNDLDSFEEALKKAEDLLKENNVNWKEKDTVKELIDLYNSMLCH